MQSSDTIRNLNFGSSLDYYKGVDGRIETRTQEATAGIAFENKGFVNITATETFDRLVNPFAIRPSIDAGGRRLRVSPLRPARRQRQPPESRRHRQHELG